MSEDADVSDALPQNSPFVDFINHNPGVSEALADWDTDEKVIASRCGLAAINRAVYKLRTQKELGDKYLQSWLGLTPVDATKIDSFNSSTATIGATLVDKSALATRFKQIGVDKDTLNLQDRPTTYGTTTSNAAPDYNALLTLNHEVQTIQTVASCMKKGTLETEFAEYFRVAGRDYIDVMIPYALSDPTGVTYMREHFLPLKRQSYLDSLAHEKSMKAGIIDVVGESTDAARIAHQVGDVHNYISGLEYPALSVYVDLYADAVSVASG